METKKSDGILREIWLSRGASFTPKSPWMFRKSRLCGPYFRNSFSGFEDVWPSKKGLAWNPGRAPELHEAVFDFGESRVSVPRELLDTAGQLQKIDVDMKLDVLILSKAAIAAFIFKMQSQIPIVVNRRKIISLSFWGFLIAWWFGSTQNLHAIPFQIENQWHHLTCVTGGSGWWFGIPTVMKVYYHCGRTAEIQNANPTHQFTILSVSFKAPRMAFLYKNPLVSQ